MPILTWKTVLQALGNPRLRWGPRHLLSWDRLPQVRLLQWYLCLYRSQATVKLVLKAPLHSYTCTTYPGFFVQIAACQGSI